MKWFKHMTSARNGNSMSIIINEFGLHKAYGCYFLLTEALAEKWDGLSQPVFEMNLRQLQFILGMKSKQVENYLRTTSELEFWSVEQNQNIFTIKFPKLLEIRDEYSKKSGQTPDSVGTNSGADKDKETDIEQSKNINAQRARRASPFTRSDFDSVYQEYPRKEGKSKGIDKCQAQVKNEADFQALRSAISRYKAHCEGKGIEPQYIKHFSSFMASWRDWLDPATGTSTIKAEESWEEQFLKGESA